MTDFELKDNAFLRQFEACVEGEMAKIEYAAQERKIFLTKLIVPDSLNTSSFKEAFLTKVLDHIGESKLKVMPTCPEVASFLKRNKLKYQGMLPVGIRI